MLWKPIAAIGYEGQPVVLPGRVWNGLLERIQAMPQGRPISFADARIMFMNELTTLMMECIGLKDEPLMGDWVAWIASKGYQIKLTGTEYEMSLSEKTH